MANMRQSVSLSYDYEQETCICPQTGFQFQPGVHETGQISNINIWPDVDFEQLLHFVCPKKGKVSTKWAIKWML